MRHIDKRMNWWITYNKEKRSGEKEWEAVEIKRKTSRGIGNCKEDSQSKTALLETKKWFFFYFILFGRRPMKRVQIIIISVEIF